MSKKRYDVIYIEWYDPAFGTTGWYDIDEEIEDLKKATKERKLKSVGIKIYEDKDIICFSNSLCHERGLVGGSKVVLKRNIVKKKILYTFYEND